MSFFTTYIQVDSRMDNDINPGQKINNFEVHLKKPIYLTTGAAIALADISFPNSINNIPEFVRDMKISVSSDPITNSIRIDGDHDYEGLFYESHSRLIDVMNEKLDPSIGQYITFASEVKTNGYRYFQVKYTDKFLHETNSFTPPQVKIIIPDELKFVLGMAENIIEVNNNVDFEAPMIMENTTFEPYPVFLQWPVWIRVSLILFKEHIATKNEILRTTAILIDHLKTDSIHIDGDHIYKGLFYGSHLRLIDVMNEKLDPSIGQYITFASEVKTDGYRYFQVKYTDKFLHETDSFTLPRVKIVIPNELKYILGLKENNITVKKDVDFEAPFTMQNTAFTPYPIYLRNPVRIRVNLIPFKGHISMEDGIARTAASLIDRLNASLDENLKQVLEIGNHEDRLKITKRSDSYRGNIIVVFPVELRGLFGLNQRHGMLWLNDENPQYTCDRPPDLNALYPGVIICYSDFINHSIIGGEFYSVLKMIPLRKTNEEDNYISIHFEHLEFLNCNTSRLDILHFQLKRLDGSYVDFVNNEKILLNLAIRNTR